MKNTWILPGVIIAGWMSVCGSLAAGPVVRHVSLKVTLENGSDYKKIKGSNEKTRTEKCKLHITLDNRDDKPVKDLQVKWTIFGRKVGKDDLVTSAKGTRKVSLHAFKTMEFSSDSASFNGTPKHTVTTTNKKKGRNNGGGRGRNTTHTKTVAASGEHYYGYAVQVYDGNVLLDQAFSLNRLKVGK
jgi:hypothetical protein